jgi:hypothetical protein
MMSGVVLFGKAACGRIPDIWSMVCDQDIPNTNNSQVSIINK